MKGYRLYIVVMLICLIAVCASFFLARTGDGARQLGLACLSVSNAPDGTQVALFSLSNGAPNAVVYFADRTLQPCYALSHCDVSPGVMRLTNYNQDNIPSARDATLSPHSRLVFSVYIPAGITDALLQVFYQRERHGLDALKEKARGVVESYGGKLPLSVSNPYTDIKLAQPFRLSEPQP